MDIIERLRKHALPDPHDEREVMHAPLLREAADEVERLTSALKRIDAWAKAYPTEVFPEPDFAKANEVLKAAGITLDAISAANMRHVLNGVQEIVHTAQVPNAQDNRPPR